MSIVRVTTGFPVYVGSYTPAEIFVDLGIHKSRADRGRFRLRLPTPTLLYGTLSGHFRNEPLISLCYFRAMSSLQGRRPRAHRPARRPHRDHLLGADHHRAG